MSRPLGLTQADYEELEFPRKSGETKVPLPPRRYRTVVNDAFWFAAWTIVFLFMLCLYGLLAFAGREDDL